MVFKRKGTKEQGNKRHTIDAGSSPGGQLGHGQSSSHAELNRANTVSAAGIGGIKNTKQIFLYCEMRFFISSIFHFQSTDKSLCVFWPTYLFCIHQVDDLASRPVERVVLHCYAVPTAMVNSTRFKKILTNKVAKINKILLKFNKILLKIWWIRLGSWFARGWVSWGFILMDVTADAYAQVQRSYENP